MNRTSKQIAHVDMDAFFVSVELLYQPELRGRPVVVGAPGDQRGVVAAASYEARKFGIHSAMASRTAKRLCPDTIFLSGNHGLYEEWSRTVRGILERFTPVVQMVSHLPCSIGVGPSYVVAKVASESAKPRGLLWVPPGAEAAFLAPLSVRRIPGIGGVTEKSLAELGVRTVGELARESLYRKARGQDAELWFVDEEQKSISHERTFPEDVNDETELEGTLAYLSQLVGQRLREGGFHARTVTLKLRSADFKTLTRAHTLAEATDLDSVLYETAVSLFRRTWKRRRKIRLLGVAASQLGPAPAQPSLFDAERQARLEKLARAADQVRSRHGVDAVRSAKSLLRKTNH
jgi:DNA polymerase-4